MQVVLFHKSSREITMQKQIIQHPEIKLVGLKVRTKNQDESSPDTAKIAPLIVRYWSENIAEKIPHRKNPGVRVVGYANYESDEYGEYDYYFGEEVTSFNKLPAGLSSLTIPAGKYLKLTSGAGPVPEVIVHAWHKVWHMTTNNQLGAQRTYNIDFEIYDERANDPQHTVFDIYLGIE